MSYFKTQQDLEKIKLLPMSCAPKDGTNIIIMSESNCNYISFFQAWWSKPKTIENWEIRR